MVEEKETKEYELVEVPTQTTLVIKTPKGEMWNEQKALTEILNKVDDILDSVK